MKTVHAESLSKRSVWRLTLFALVLTVVPLVGSACGADWWLPKAQDEPTMGVSTVASDASSGSTDEDVFGAEPTPIGVTVDNFATRWNAAVSADEAADVLPDDIVADDTSDGLSTAQISAGDATVTLQWLDSTGDVTLVQVDQTVDGDLASSTAASTVRALAEAALNLDAKQSAQFVDRLTSSALETSPDGAWASATTEEGTNTVTFDLIDGTVRVSIFATS